MSTHASEATSPKGLLIDTTLCIGCGACSLACAERNALPTPAVERRDTDLSDRAFTVVRSQGGRFVRRLCMHCQEPTCVSVCPVGACQKTRERRRRLRRVDAASAAATASGLPLQRAEVPVGQVLPRVRKCDLCAGRLAEGQPTACASVCPTGATLFGEPRRADRRGARADRGQPGPLRPHVYGAEEAGGTSVLLLSDVPFAALG